MDADITADQLIKIINDEESAELFPFEAWFNDLDQKIFTVKEDDGSQKVAELLWVQDFSEWHTICLRHRAAGFPYGWFGKGSKKNFSLMNATNEEMAFEVRYETGGNHAKYPLRAHSLKKVSLYYLCIPFLGRHR